MIFSPVSETALVAAIAQRVAAIMQADVRVLVMYLTTRHHEKPLDLHGLRYLPDAALLDALDLKVIDAQ